MVKKVMISAVSILMIATFSATPVFAAGGNGGSLISIGGSFNNGGARAGNGGNAGTGSGGNGGDTISIGGSSNNGGASAGNGGSGGTAGGGAGSATLAGRLQTRFSR